MTWKDIKLATIQKMFSANGTTIPADDSTRDYLAAMPYVANEGILMIATAGKFVIKNFSISINPIKNLLASIASERIHTMVSGDLTYDADNAHSFYVEVTGRCTITITIDETDVYEQAVDSVNAYTTYKGMIPNSENAKVTIKFSSEYPYAIKNVALYEAKYQDDSEVPDFSEKVRFYIPDIVEDFHSINSIYFEGNNPRYIKTDDVYKEGDKILAFDRETPGNYIVYYNALPVTITIATEDDYELPLDKEVAAILPLYMASQLFKEDDISIATQYRNEFEVAYERLQNAVEQGKTEKVESVSGWC